MGGLENPRMLLNLTRQKPNGIGNDHDLVGRFFCDHPSYKVVDLLYARAPAFASDHFAPTLDFMLREQVLNFTVRLLVHQPPPASRLAALKGAATCAAPFTERLAERVLGRQPPCRWGGLAEYGIRRDPTRHPTGHVTLYTEQLLDRDSRVMLAEATDDFGLRRIRLDWRLGEIDYRTMQVAIRTLGAHLAEQDIGRMRVQDWVLEADPVLPEDADDEWRGSHHHMCTTRMADDPREGVVDRNCRVHGTANLYLGGCSVFATPGFATPTYTIVQLALRLGDHLASAPSEGDGGRLEFSGHGAH
jgi:choline dehydrogenase-like flavoprotein